MNPLPFVEQERGVTLCGIRICSCVPDAVGR